MDLYGEIILDHYKNPHHHGKLDHASFSAQDLNPLCGDRLYFDLLVGDDDRVTDVGFTGQGCAISQASASMLADELIGKTLPEITAISPEDLYALLAVPLSPARVKCALLSLVTVKKALSSKH